MYINTSASDEIKQLDDDLKANRWGVKSVLEIKDSIELLTFF